MVEKLKIKAIYDDFVRNVFLTEEQIKILNMLINGDSIVKISMEIGMSERTVSYEIRKLKDLYKGYYSLQITKTQLLKE
jgi:DNA-binding NarL/FixJ family response regulator